MNRSFKILAISACCCFAFAQCANDEKGPTGSDIEQTDEMRNDMGDDRNSADTMEDLKDYPGDSV